MELSERLPINIRLETFHDERRVSQRFETKLSVQPVCVFGCQQESPEPLQFFVARDEFHKPLRQAVASMRVEDEDICEIRERCLIGNHTSEAYLLRPEVHAKTKRVCDGSLYNFAWNTRRPITLRKKRMNDCDIDALAISGNLIFAAACICWHVGAL